MQYNPINLQFPYYRVTENYLKRRYTKFMNLK